MLYVDCPLDLTKPFPCQECIVVCVVSLEELKITPGNVPYEQCREIRTEGAGKVRKIF